MRDRVCWVVFLLCNLAVAEAAAAADPLPALAAEPGNVTVSGLSSGGFMAVQMHVAHSAIVKGAGVLAGGPYYCAQGSLSKAYYNCTDPGLLVPLPATLSLAAEAEAQAKAGRIDATGNLASSRAWLFAGAKDKTVSRDVVEALLAFYASFKVAAVIVRDQPAGHAMVTMNAGSECGLTQTPFINHCGYDAAGELLHHLLGPAAASAPESGRLMRFDQDAFAGGDALSISMASDGFAYIPQACASARCRVHVAFHGCRQNAGEVGERYVREAGYNRWADAYRLIVLYPQTATRSGFAFGRLDYLWNPRGCWDWWGYTGARYHTKEGAQIRAVKSMLERLSGPR